jgi:MscS family membrane protein
MVVDTLLSETYGGSTVAQYVIFFAILTVGAVVGRAWSFILERHLLKKTEATGTDLDDVIVRSLGGPIALLGVVVAAALGRGVLTPTETAATVLSALLDVLLIVAITWLTVRFTNELIARYLGTYAEATDSKLDDALVPIVNRMTNVAIVSIAAVVILDSFGYDVTAIVASIGIGGIALAFAARRTLSDVFGGAHILSTKPFLVDDVIEVDDVAGTVEEIGLRCTVVRDGDGRLVTIPNSTIAGSTVRNVSSEPTHRVKTLLDLPYDLGAEDMAAALDRLERAVGGVEGVDPERTSALFWAYGDSSKRVRLEYHVADPDGWMAVRNAANREIQAAMESAGIEMGLPSRAIRLEESPTVPDSPGSPAGAGDSN